MKWLGGTSARTWLTSSFQEARLKPREVESLCHWANQRQSQDQNPGLLTLLVKDHSSSFDFIGGCQKKSVPRIERRPGEAIGKSFGSMYHPRERPLAETPPVCHQCCVLEMSRGTVPSCWSLILWFSLAAVPREAVLIIASQPCWEL